MSEQKSAQDDWVYFRDGWLRFHRPPKSVQRTTSELWSPRQRWLFERSRERYDASELGARMNDLARKAMMCGEIGSYSVFRFIQSPIVQAHSEDGPKGPTWREQRAALTRGRRW